MNHESDFGPTLHRLGIGILFISAGGMKLMNPSMIIGMLGEMGFPSSTALGWLLLLSELVFGTLVLVGWKVKYTVWPLAVILAVALVTAWLPQMGTNPMAPVVSLLHVATILSLVGVALSGAGALSLDSD